MKPRLRFSPEEPNKHQTAISVQGFKDSLAEKCLEVSKYPILECSGDSQGEVEQICEGIGALLQHAFPLGFIWEPKQGTSKLQEARS